MIKNIGFILLGFVISSYAFIINGYKTEYIEPNSDRWYQLIKDGRLPKPLEITYSEMKSNGHIFEIIGTINNPRNIQTSLTKISADLFDKQNNFYHKCETFILMIPANSKYNFKFHCANIKDINYENHSNIIVYVDA